MTKNQKKFIGEKKIIVKSFYEGVADFDEILENILFQILKSIKNKD